MDDGLASVHGILGRPATEPIVPRPPLLVVGLSGQLGDALRRRGLPMPARALSRQPRPPLEGVNWRRGGLETLADEEPYAFVLSLGPLDALAVAVAEGRLRAGRIVAFGSTSVHVKGDSPDPAEQDLARRLGDAERVLGETCAARGTVLFLLRPTLVWGMGRDATLSRVAALARKWPVLPLPLAAPGLRQPVHALDLADAALAALRADPAAAGAYDLPGGERLTFGEMLRRSAAAAAPRCRLVGIPPALLARFGAAPAGLRGLASRLHRDLVFDDAGARAALGWSPRDFRPTAADFPP